MAAFTESYNLTGNIRKRTDFSYLTGEKREK
jgi:hypothetical protein